MFSTIRPQLAHSLTLTLNPLLKSHQNVEFQFDATELETLLERPKNPEHGQLALPLFKFAKLLRKSPQDLAVAWQDAVQQQTIIGVASVRAIGGYLNFILDPAYMLNVLYLETKARPQTLGFGKSGQGRRVVIDFSSPNVAKPMSIGHLRATVIGQAVVNLARAQSYEVIGLNHLGDWGVQFGKLAWAFENWGHEYPFATKPFESLFNLYVRFHTEVKVRPELEALGSETFRRLEQGDPEIRKLWEHFVKISMVEYTRLWKRLGVHHDLVRGESFYNDRLVPTEKLLEDKNLLQESDGAMVVPMDDPKVPPCLIRKSDGASLYATRDIASAIFRMEELKADLNLYVVGVDQTLHFKQVFEVLRKMGYPWSKCCHHIAFGMYRFKDLRMSTRTGNVVFLEDVLNRAYEMALARINEKNPDLANKEMVAEQVGVGAIVFNDLLNDRIKDVDFDWDRVLDFEGNSGPYVQYMSVRAQSILRKAGGLPEKPLAPLTAPAEVELMAACLALSDVLELSFQNFKPHLVAGYTIDVCRLFSQFYTHHRILGEAPDVEASRVWLVEIFRCVVSRCLAVLNVPIPAAM